MNLFDNLERALYMLSVKIPDSIISLINSLREEFFDMNQDILELNRDVQELWRENQRLKRENLELSEAIMAHVERDLSHMKNLVKKVNSSTATVVEELD